ncbi:MAG TPA: AmmeMemoRadiSam system protein A [Candidatus Acidoferrales bacterium]|nr:AmmeMemoRadiSam system protein A [Candidatus Acidoferrales bacterium]
MPLPALESRAKLLRVARQSIESALGGGSLPPVICEGELAERRGVFVTLTFRNRLRGCVGQVEPIEPLGHAVAHSAIAAATEDTRFARVLLHELPEIEIELSVLSLLQPIRPEEIVVGIHGLMVTRGYRRGLLLPQVGGERSWTTERFLEETCAKAGLDRKAWKAAGTLIEGFEAGVFSEREVNAALQQAGPRAFLRT